MLFCVLAENINHGSNLTVWGSIFLMNYLWVLPDEQVWKKNPSMYLFQYHAVQGWGLVNPRRIFSENAHQIFLFFNYTPSAYIVTIYYIIPDSIVG